MQPDIKNIVRVGIVSSINAAKSTARVKIQEQGIVTGDLKVVQQKPMVECEECSEVTAKPWMPEVGQWVLCIFIPDGEGDGFVLGGI